MKAAAWAACDCLLWLSITVEEEGENGHMSYHAIKILSKLTSREKF
jgi:hypothetical protein